MNPQKRRTTGKYRVAEDHCCQGVRQSTSSLREGRKKREKEEEEGLNFSKKNLQVLVTQWAGSPPTGWVRSPLFPFASCAFQAPCWAPNRRLLHSGPVPYSHPPTARSQVPLHLLPTHRHNYPKGYGGGGHGGRSTPHLPRGLERF